MVDDHSQRFLCRGWIVKPQNTEIAVFPNIGSSIKESLHVAAPGAMSPFSYPISPHRASRRDVKENVFRSPALSVELLADPRAFRGIVDVAIDY